MYLQEIYFFNGNLCLPLYWTETLFYNFDVFPSDRVKTILWKYGMLQAEFQSQQVMII